MHKILSRLAIASVLAAGALAVGTRAEAAGVAPSSGLQPAINAQSLLQHVQIYTWSGHRWCWFDDGWNGPGWYWCDYRVGFGWGGGYGWHGWRGGHVRGRAIRGRTVIRNRTVIRGGRSFSGRGGRSFSGRGGRGSGGMGGGGMGGGGGGGMRSSDIRLKHDVVLLGHLDNGLGFYRFSYNGSDKAYVGVMAQDVQTVMPDAVVRGSDGYLLVNYDKLGLRMQTWDSWVASGEHIPTTRH